jgi:hypothetical protein
LVGTCRDALGGAIGFVSDANLATHLLHDAHMGRFDVAVVVSNDSDLLLPVGQILSDEPIRMIQSDHPAGKRMSGDGVEPTGS